MIRSGKQIERFERLKASEEQRAIVYGHFVVDVGGWRFACGWLKFRRRRRSEKSRPTRWSWRLGAS